MKKLFVGTMLAVLLAATPAMAAETAPVIFNGEDLGDAHIGDGRTYLPFRVIFEACGAAVDWDGETKTVIAYPEGSGAVLTMRPGEKTAVVTQGSMRAEMALDAAPYIKNGRTYVPVRFVSDTLGYDVEWDNAAKQVNISVPGLGYADGEDVYALNIKTGEIALWQGGQDKVMLGVCDIEQAGNYEISGLKVTKTAGGNYLAEVNIWTSGAITVSAKLYTWIDAETGEAYTVNSGDDAWVRQQEPMVTGDTMWLCGDGVVYQIDEAAGKLIKEWRTGEMMREMTGIEDDTAVLEWANDEYMLISSRNTLKWGLVSLADGMMTDISDELLTEEVIKRMDDMMRPYIEPYLRDDWTYDENYRDYFWAGTVNKRSLDEAAEMSLIEEKDGVLYFVLQSSVCGEFGIPLEYELKQAEISR